MLGEALLLGVCEDLTPEGVLALENFSGTEEGPAEVVAAGPGEPTGAIGTVNTVPDGPCGPRERVFAGDP